MPITSPRGLHRVILRVALASISVFAWIFVFQFFYVRTGSMANGIASAALTYALAQVVTILVTPWAAAHIRHGFKRLLVYSVLMLATALTILAASFAGYMGSAGWGIGLFAILMGTYRALYWVPYAVAREASPTHRKGYRGTEIIVALMPALAGLALTSSPIAPIGLLCAAAVLAICSIFPLAGMRDVYEGFLWGYRQTFHELFAHSRRRMTLGAVSSGIEGAALLLFWPLVVFVLLNWSYPMLGIVVSVTYLVTLSLRGLVERPLSHLGSPVLALLAASAWIMRLTVGGAIGVILVDTYFYVGSRPPTRGIDSSTFEQTADNTTFVDEHSALKEMGLALGRIIICLIVAVLASFVSVPLTFVTAFLIAAAAAAYSVYLGRTPPRIA
jgi:hypothetical protein